MSKFKKLDKKVKRMDIHDVQLTKLSTAAGILFLITVWPALHNLVMRLHWGWYLGAMVVFAIRPMNKFLR